MKTKILSLFFALTCVSSVFAEVIDSIVYNLNTEEMTATVTEKYGDYSGDIIIPSTITYNSQTYTVTTIGYSAFAWDHLASLTIPASITKIEDQAFYYCQIDVTNYLGTIEQWCKIDLEETPASCSEKILINNIEIKDLIIPNTITTIGVRAFLGWSSLISVTIPNSVTTIEFAAFKGCSGLTSVAIPNSVTTIGGFAFERCSGLTSVTIPNSVTGIVDGTFHGCSGLTSITIPNSVTWIGNEAFYICSGLTSITIPNSVTAIGEWAFNGCSGLTSVTIPNSVTWIGESAFNNCSCDVFMEATTPPYVYDNTFDWRIQNIYVPCGTKEVYQSAWQDYASRIKNIPYPSYIITKKSENGTIKTTTTDFTICDEPLVTCTANPNRGFFFVQWADGNTDNPRTIELTQDTTLEAIFDYFLTGKCGKDSALAWTLDKSTMALNITGTGALSENYTYGTFIESLTINNEITSIGQDAFYGCKNLKKIIIGSSVKVLEERAFYSCSTIESITCYSQRPPTVNNYALYGLDYGTIVYVPADYLNTYKMHDAWGLYDVRPIGAKNVETTEVTTSTTNNDVTITWPITDGTETYTLTITKNGETVCVLTFNAQGQLTNIAFAAPGHNGTHQAPAATLTAQGYQFTVTGLTPSTAYNYSVVATDAGGKTVAEHKGNFSTTGGGTGLNTLPYEGKDGKGSKYFHNGVLVIDRNGQHYSITGQKLR